MADGHEERPVQRIDGMVSHIVYATTEEGILYVVPPGGTQ